MTVFLLANVGHRDVLLRGQRIERAREDGARILNAFESHAADLSLPILSPAIEQLLGRHGKIQVVLFGTDQPDWTPAEHRAKDTIHLAEVAARLLHLRYREKGLDKVWPKAVDGNPALYDDMLLFFRNQLSPSQRWTQNVELCNVYPVGGTPAANAGLMLAAVERFGERCRILYLPEGESRPREMDVGRQLQRTLAGELAADRLSEFAFESAVPLLERAGAYEGLASLARCVGERYHFDFEAAAARLEVARQQCTDNWEARSLCNRFHQQLLELRDRRLPALVRELYHNAEVAWRRGEYAAFLGRVFRFQEALLRLMVEELYPDISTEVDDETTRKRFSEIVRGRPSLLRYLESQRGNGRPLDYSAANRTVFAAMVRYAWEGDERLSTAERQEQLRAGYLLLERFDCLSGLRNKSIIAHGFAGVSRNRILEVYKGRGYQEEPLHDMAEVLCAVGIQLGENPFSSSAQFLMRELEKL